LCDDGADRDHEVLNSSTKQILSNILVFLNTLFAFQNQ